MKNDAIHQLVVVGSVADLATSKALRLRDALRPACESDVYGVAVTRSAEGEVIPVSRLDGSDPEQLLVYHIGSASPLVTQKLLAFRTRVVLWWSSDRPANDDADWIRYELRLIQLRVVGAVVESEVGMEALTSAGISSAVMMNVAPGAGQGVTQFSPDDVTSRLEGRPFVLLVESPGIDLRSELVVQGISIVQRVIGREVGLVVVACENYGLHGSAVREFARRLGLQWVWFASEAGGAEVAALVQHAAVIVIAGDVSDSPAGLLANSVGTPVITIDAASPGQGSVSFTHTDGSIVLAELIDRLIIDGETRDRLVRSGQSVASARSAADQTPQLVSYLLGLV